MRDVRSNTAAIVRSIERAAAAGADILLTPEGSLSGCTSDFDADEVTAALELVTSRARREGLGLALGTSFVEDDGCCYNELRFYERDGTYLGHHSKILLCGPFMSAAGGDSEVDKYSSGSLRTFQFGGITIAGLICNDLWATPGWTPTSDPYLVRQAANLGAKIIFHAVNGGRVAGKRWDLIRTFAEVNVRIRAAAFRIPIVSVDNAAPLTVRCSSPEASSGRMANGSCGHRGEVSRCS